MSFSFDTKNELCRQPVQKLCCARAEAYGILLYCHTFRSEEVRIITENPDFAARLPRLFQRAFGLSFDRLPEPEQPGKQVFQMTEREKLDQVIHLLGYHPRQNLALHLNFAMVEEPCCRGAFLRGAFFAGGSVTDPQKRYHLELTTSHLQVSREMEALLRECGYPPKSVARNGSFVTYFKQSRQIEDFLTLIGAPAASVRLMSAKLEKDLRNSVNRRLNCDSANLDKTVEAAQSQLEAIRRLQRTGRLEGLPDKLRETAALRLRHPELTLAELALEFDPAVTKSCLNHRLRKLVETANAMETMEEERKNQAMDRYALACDLHHQGFNCAQAVALSFQDCLNLPAEQIAAVAGGFGGGVGGSHEELCGAVSGGVMVLSLKNPHTRGEDAEGKRRLYEICREFRRRFEEIFACTRCGDLLTARPAPSEKTPAAQRMELTRHCDVMIVTAVELVETLLKELEG